LHVYNYVMGLDIAERHQRFVQQAGWTRDLRRYLFKVTTPDQVTRVLEVGCGTGAVLGELDARAIAVHGLDIQWESLEYARTILREPYYLCGDGHHLPYPDDCFDLVFCHFLLLWVARPAAVLAEMTRVARPGGAVLAMAEPDYGWRVDYPHPLATLGAKQRQALSRQGADPLSGRQLPALFDSRDFQGVVSGVLEGQWGQALSPQERALEWKTLADDLDSAVDGEELKALRELDQAAWERGERILFVPTFYAWGKVV
jgi:ubiquinone/menaquinone biosynthesis C-methylase UbiE